VTVGVGLIASPFADGCSRRQVGLDQLAADGKG